MTKTDQQNVPKLRFPDFQGEWTRRRCDYFLRRETIQVSPEARKTYREIGIRSHGKGVFHKEPVLGQSLGDKRVFEVVPDTLALNIVFAWEQALAVLSDEEKGFIASHRFPMFSGHPDRGNVEFFKYFFLRPRGKWLLELASPGGAGRNKTLGQSNFAELKLVAPTLPEQRKIADFLGTVDTKIGQLAEKKRLLEDYKKGCMQQIFSQKTRFKDDDGNAFPDWEEKPLGNVGKTFGGLTGKSADDFGTGARFITYLQVFKASQIYPEQCGFVEISAGERQNKIQRGDIMFTTSSETPKEVGFASVVTIDIPDTYLNSFCFALRPYDTEALLPEFSRYLFRSDGYRNKVIPLAQGSTRYNLSKTNFLKIELNIPHPDEQRKIADFLGNLDRKIDLMAQEINYAQNFRKGLLQQMFI